MASFGGVRVVPYIATLIASILSGCGSPYEDIRALAAQSPGIGIEDVEVMAFDAFLDQRNRGNTHSTSFPVNLFLNPPLTESEIRRIYLADPQGCDQNRTDGSFRCLRRVLVGNVLFDVPIEYESQRSGMKIVSFYADRAPQL